ncbi:MAG: cytochrome c peroxidase [Planctomycetota bacterium]|jgi:cytochrome c peroxidase
MKYSALLLICICAGVSAPVFAQGPDPVMPATPDNYSSVTLPAHFFVQGPGGGLSVVGQDNTPGFNPTTDAGAALGRVLFYDPSLSLNHSVSCSSCHSQADGFSDSAALSVGFDGGLTGRHSMGLSNARFYDQGHFFWDERAATLEDQVLMPLQDSVEMGMTLPLVVERIEQRDFYAPLFTEAFGDATVTTGRASRALAQFVRSVVSYQSRYDQGRALVGNPTQNFPNFTAQENLGKNLFTAPPQNGGFGCASCHTGEAQLNRAQGATNNGLINNAAADQGVFHATGNTADRGKFKVPSLRNIAVTAPYMHDGRFSTLQEVLGFYSTGIQNHPNLDPVLRAPGGGQPIRFNMSPGEINALVAFFDTLTDTTMLNDPKFSDPFPTEMGFTYCDTAVDNSTGFAASISATGSVMASDNNLTLHAVSLPQNQFSMFVAGPSQELVLNPGGSQGNLCVGGGLIGGFGRLATSLQLSGSIGAISHQLDLQNMPIAAAPYHMAITSGMTWNFQSWFRESGGNSNFSNAVSILFF